MPVIARMLVAPALVAFAILAGCAWGAKPETADGAVTLSVSGREIAPGEPLRAVVTADGPLSSVEGTFLGRALFFVGSGTRWEAWSVVPLDAEAGRHPMEIAARAASGTRLGTSRPLLVARKEFPEQRLKVEDRYVSPDKVARRRIEKERARLDAIYAVTTTRPLPTGPFEPPVPGGPTSSFGTRRFFNDQPRSPHAGLDLEAASGTSVKAAGDGTVVLADDLYFAGKTVILDHGAGLFTIYAHLSELRVAEGDDVRRGVILALSGATGRVTGPHLHWGARIGDTIFDPRALCDPRLFEDEGPERRAR